MEAPSTNELRTSRCVMCYEGYTVAPGENGAEVPCITCCGTGWVTPQNICYCGRPCYFVTNGTPHCGLSKCLDELEKNARIAKAIGIPFRGYTPPAAHNSGGTRIGGGPAPWWSVENQGWD